MIRSQNRILPSVIKQFVQVQKLSNFNKTHIFELIKQFREYPSQFAFSLYQTYLKIFKSCLDKANRKIPTKYQTLAQTFFRQIFDFNESWERDSNMIMSLDLFNNFIELLIQSIFSSVMNIRIMGARLTFLIIKLIPQKYLNRAMSTTNKESFVSAILHLLRIKVSTYRQLGAKLASLAQKIDCSQVKNIQTEMLKIASLDENDQIRKMVITNLLITPENVDKILIRLRDKSMDIRSIIIKKLQNESYIINKQRFNLSQIYKLLYDGYGSRQIDVKNQCLHYYTLYFDQIEAQKLRNKQKQMDIERGMQQMQIEQTEGHLLSNNNSFRKFGQFVEMFNPNIMLLNPHLYSLFNNLIFKLIEKIPSNLFIDYVLNLKDRLQELQENPSKFTKENINSVSMQLIWVKNCVKSHGTQVATLYKQKSLTGTQLAKLLKIFVQNQQLYGTYELLQYFQNETKQIPDQYGRNQMFNSLYQVLKQLPYFSPIYPLQFHYQRIPQAFLNQINISVDINQELKIDHSIISQDDDICKIPSHSQVKTQLMMLSSYNDPLITSSFDLISYFLSVMKILRPSYYQNQIREIISQLNNPAEKSYNENVKLQTQKSINNLTKMNSKKKSQVCQDKIRLQYEFNKLLKIQRSTKEDKQKTRKLIMSLSKISGNNQVKDFFFIIEQNLNSDDQSNGILLLAMQCLQSVQNLEKYFEIFWMNFSYLSDEQQHQIASQQRKNSILISIRSISDFVIKHDILNPSTQINFKFEQSKYIFTQTTLLNNLFKLILHQDSDIKILALQTLCKFMYHEKIHNNQMRTIAFSYLLFLWWSTDSQSNTAKTVHTISKFFKSYVDPNSGKQHNLIKLAQGFCVFFKLVMNQFKNHKRINKSKIIYNLKLDQFMKKAIYIATGILKQRKSDDEFDDEDNKFSDINLKAQQLFILFLLSENYFEDYFEKPFQICNFYENASIEVLILMNQTLKKLVQQGRKTSKNQNIINKFEQLIQEQIQKRNQTSSHYDVATFKILSQQLQRKLRSFNQDLKVMIQHVQQQQLFIQDDESSINDSQNIHENEQLNSQDNLKSCSKSQKSYLKRQQFNFIKEKQNPQIKKKIESLDQEQGEKSSSQSVEIVQNKKNNIIKKKGRPPQKINNEKEKERPNKIQPPPSNMRITRSRKVK